ncbi:MAG: S41 family peptidase, partial [Pseudomonadota bacterium]
FHPIDWMQSRFDAVMAFVADTDALIIDLSENGGGYSPSDAYLASYFFNGEPGIWSSSYTRPTDQTESVNLFEDISGARYLDRPVYILVSKNTFSLAEQLAYGLKHFGKATIVGETSSGAAHAIDIGYLNENFFLQVPISYNIHPVTKTDWEGTGVIADIQTQPNQAKAKAHLAALELLSAAATNERIVKWYGDILAELTASE